MLPEGMDPNFRRLGSFVVPALVLSYVFLVVLGLCLSTIKLTLTTAIMIPLTTVGFLFVFGVLFVTLVLCVRACTCDRVFSWCTHEKDFDLEKPEWVAHFGCTGVTLIIICAFIVIFMTGPAMYDVAMYDSPDYTRMELESPAKFDYNINGHQKLFAFSAVDTYIDVATMASFQKRSVKKAGSGGGMDEKIESVYFKQDICAAPIKTRSLSATRESIRFWVYSTNPKCCSSCCQGCEWQASGMLSSSAVHGIVGYPISQGEWYVSAFGREVGDADSENRPYQWEGNVEDRVAIARQLAIKNNSLSEAPGAARGLFWILSLDQVQDERREEGRSKLVYCSIAVLAYFALMCFWVSAKLVWCPQDDTMKPPPVTPVGLDEIEMDMRSLE